MSQPPIPNSINKKPVGSNRIAIGSNPRPIRSGVMVIGNQKPVKLLEPHKSQPLSIGTKKHVSQIDNSFSLIPIKPQEVRPNILKSGPVIVLPNLTDQIELEMTKLDALESEISLLEKNIWQEKQSSNDSDINQDQSKDTHSTFSNQVQDTAEPIPNLSQPITQTPPSSLLTEVTTQNLKAYSNSNATLYLSLCAFCLALVPLVFLTLPTTSLIINSFLLFLVLGFFFGFRRAKVMEARASLKEQMHRSFQQYIDQKN